MNGPRVSNHELDFYAKHGRWTADGAPAKIELVLDLQFARKRITELEDSLEMHRKLRAMRFQEPE